MGPFRKTKTENRRRRHIANSRFRSSLTFVRAWEGLGWNGERSNRPSFRCPYVRGRVRRNVARTTVTLFRLERRVFAPGQ